ncbi:hypothetical protein [Halobaculum sp. EA56]|uniref:hypothetical protein n=1 Tax=Halobaculum sp. EA56 TaxID=3421648 RepID=UPI003EB6F7D2
MTSDEPRTDGRAVDADGVLDTDGTRDGGRPSDEATTWDDPPAATGAVGDEGGRGRTDPPPVHITADLLALLLDRAADADPDEENVVLDATAAGDLVDAPGDLDPSTPVLTHFYFPAAGGSVTAVFGMDLGRPSGAARFLSHPDADRRLTEADDLAAAVLVAVPPYGEDDVVAYDRRGRRRDLIVVDAHPPEERVEDEGFLNGE